MLKAGWSQIVNRSLLFSALILSCYSTLVGADSLALNFVVVKNEGIYGRIIEVVEQTLNNRGIETTFQVVEINNHPPETIEGRVVTIGTQAAAYTYQHFPESKITSALLTRSGFEQLAGDSFGSADKAIDHGVKPLLLNQPLSRFFGLGSLLVPQAKRVGVLVGPANEQLLPEIREQARLAGLELSVALLKPDDNPIQIIEPVVKKSDFVVVLPDRKLINQLAAKWVLPLSYRYRIPVIAYSQKYVAAGALASVYSSAEDVGHIIADSLLSKKNIHPRFSISLNKSVARSLGIRLEDEDVYRVQLKSEGVGAQ